MSDLYLAVDVEDDLARAGDRTFQELVAAAHLDDLDDVALVGGTPVVSIDANDVRAAYLAACERAWLAEARRQGHRAGPADPADPAYQSGQAANLAIASPEDIAAAWQAVWDAVKLPELPQITTTS